MAFRASPDIKAAAYSEAKRLALSLRDYCSSVRAAAAAGPISGNVLVELLLRLIANRGRLNAIRLVPGIGLYAQDQEADLAYDLAAEFTSMLAAIDSVINLVTGINTTNWITFSAGGVTTKSFSSAQTSGLRTQLDSLIASIS